MNEDLEQAKEHNRAKVLKMLEESKVVTNKEFTKAQIGRFGASIEQLRCEGYTISTKRIPNSDGTVEYTLTGKGEPIEKIPAKEKLRAIIKSHGYHAFADNLEEILDLAQVTLRNKPIH